MVRVGKLGGNRRPDTRGIYELQGLGRHTSRVLLGEGQIGDCDCISELYRDGICSEGRLGAIDNGVRD
jgi:hypothetical protein